MMDSQPVNVGKVKMAVTMSQLPEEILEHIFSFLSPYKDMDAVCLVSKQWHRVISSVIRQRKRHFHQNLSACKVSWTQVMRCSAGQEKAKFGTISERFSHSAAYYEGAMYVFGGCTSTNTTFNDLWKLDLTSRQWQRPLVMGAYPSPKACATMVEYKGNLVLFGGWSHPIPYPLHQSAHYFSELHMYNISSNRWTHVVSLGQEPDALGGHSASIAGHLMVVFGGSPRPGLGTNKLWVFNFHQGTWKLQPTCKNSPNPEPRYGQFQTTLDDKHILIMGGCVGQNRVFTDMWLLTLDPDGPWHWTKVNIIHPELTAPQTWCHAACRVGKKVVVIAKSSKARQAKNHRAQIYTTNTQSSDLQSASVQTSPQESWMDLQAQPSLPQQAVQSPRTQSPAQPGTIPSPTHHFAPQDNSAREAMMASTSNSYHKSEDHEPLHDLNGSQDSRANLLAWQKKLHRDCANLGDSHHHGAWQQDEAEGHFLRLHNRWANQQAGQGRSNMEHGACDQGQGPGSVNVEEGACSNSQEDIPALRHRAQDDSAQHHSLSSGAARVQDDHPCRPNSIPSIRPNGMPSIRPNAMSNRERQLQALQRQEEILRSKARALAAAKLAQGASVEMPDVIPTKNRMDVFVADVSRVISEGLAEWLPLSVLQASCAPTETICCSLLEGRGELVLFGGVVRDMSSSVPTNTAINKLYLLHA